MGLQTKKDFAEMCGLSTKNLATYIGRKKVVVGDGDLINDKDPVNKLFLDKQKNKVSEQKLVAAIAKTGPAPGAETEEDEPDIPLPEIPDGTTIPPYVVSETKLKYLDTLKREREISLLRIKEDKIRGTVIPSELIGPVLLQHNQSIVNEFKNVADEVVRMFAKKYKLPAEDVAAIKGQLIKSINDGIMKAAESSKKAVRGIVDNFSESRGKGERL